eukprot:scaffold8100_cov117-Isochrysis_galbana.AAC.7
MAHGAHAASIGMHGMRVPECPFFVIVYFLFCLPAGRLQLRIALAPAAAGLRALARRGCKAPEAISVPAQWAGVRWCEATRSTRPSHPPQPCIPEIIGRAPGEKVKGGGGKGGDASPPEDSSECVLSHSPASASNT